VSKRETESKKKRDSERERERKREIQRERDTEREREIERVREKLSDAWSIEKTSADCEIAAAVLHFYGHHPQKPTFALHTYSAF